MISVSLLSSYLYCKRKLFLERVLNLSEGPKEAPIKGKIHHKTHEETNNAEEKIVISIKETDSFEDIQNLYTGTYAKIIRNVLEYYKYPLKSVKLKKLEIFKEIWPKFQNQAKLKARNTYNFIRKHNLYGEQLWKKLTPKIKSEIKIVSEKLNLVGKIDQIELHKNLIIPVELKTGSSPKSGIWQGHKIQVAAYALLLEELYKKKVNQGSVIYLDHDIKRTIIINPFMKDEIIELRKQVEALFKSKTPPEITENKNKCLKCGLKELCYNEDFIKTRLNELNPELL
ncbi:CRISPR-associated protein Cas4 [Candidatus Woesearchaeota archaeon]|nr:CRISPR-associated protein Cas4 [Candidatus Woesearchaeota archaeon]